MNIRQEIKELENKWKGVLTKSQIKSICRKHIEMSVKNRRCSISDVKKLYFRFFEVKRNVLRADSDDGIVTVYYLDGVFYVEHIMHYEHAFILEQEKLSKEYLAECLLERILYI